MCHIVRRIALRCRHPIFANVDPCDRPNVSAYHPCQKPEDVVYGDEYVEGFCPRCDTVNSVAAVSEDAYAACKDGRKRGSEAVSSDEDQEPTDTPIVEERQPRPYATGPLRELPVRIDPNIGLRRTLDTSRQQAEAEEKTNLAAEAELQRAMEASRREYEAQTHLRRSEEEELQRVLELSRNDFHQTHVSGSTPGDAPVSVFADVSANVNIIHPEQAGVESEFMRARRMREIRAQQQAAYEESLAAARQKVKNEDIEG